MRSIELPDGVHVPVLGQGTWHMGEDPSRREDEIAALRVGLELGMRLIDSAEMYGDGASEELVGEAITAHRGEVFLVSKVLPSHASRHGTIAACERSLARLRTDYLDLYLLHWRGNIPFAETIAGFEALVTAGKIRSWGVSNLDVSDMEELLAVDGSESVQTDQVLYNLTRRGIEWDLMPFLRERRIPIMAYSPIEQGRLLAHPVVAAIADRHRVTPAQIALAWVIQHPFVNAIPKASSPRHTRENYGALAVRLTKQDLAALDQAFPPPRGPRPLEMI
jgi:diketogulonate reductase-like aldo/keto reductase